MSISVTPTARDLLFDFRYSNCSNCCRKAIDDDDPVWITKVNKLERLNARKITDRTAEIANSRLEAGVRNELTALGIEVELALIRIQQLAQIDLNDPAERAKPLTLEKVKRVSKAVREVSRTITDSPSSSSTDTRQDTATSPPASPVRKSWWIFS